MELRQSFIEAMSRAVTGVTIVTTEGPAGRFAQTLLVCIKTTSVIVNAIREHRALGVNVLRADQQRVADTFAGRPTWGEPYDFEIATWDTLETGAPLLVGAIGRFDCRLDTVLEVGSHSVMFADVVATESAPGTPLLYARRTYGEHIEIPRPVDESPLDLDVRLTWEDVERESRDVRRET